MGAAANAIAAAAAPDAAAPARHPRLGRPKPSGGIGVKNMEAFRKRNRDLKIKRLLPQSKVVNVKKTGVALRKMTVRRRSYFPGYRKKVYK